MSIAGKVRSFVGKSPRDQARLIGATVRHVQQVLRSPGRRYVAFRPDSDANFGRHPELDVLAGKWVANNRRNNEGDLPRLYALLLNIKQVMAENVPGDFAELGVYRGNSAAVLAHYGRQHGRSMFLFDTYAGFEAKDLIGVDAGKRDAFTDTSLDLVRATVGDEAVTYVQGYFPGTITESIAQRRYAVVHIDCDLYEPMKAGLEFFFDRLSPGGLLIMHDYSDPHWDGAKRAVDGYLPRIAENLIVIPDKSGTAMLRKLR